MRTLKDALLRSPLRLIYVWFANRYREIRRLFIYPDTARVGMTDYDAYWDSKFEDKAGHMGEWRLKRAQVFAQIVAKGDSVLDLGVGDGALLKYLIDERSIDGYGLDIAPKAVEFCQSQGLKVELADVNRPIGAAVAAYFPGVTQFDYIILSEIIEHLPDPESLLNTLRPVARKGIIVSIPNTGYVYHRLRLLLGRFPLQWIVTPGEHLRFWTRGDFHWWARQMKFRIAREFPYVGAPGLKEVWPSLFAAAFVYWLIE